MPGASVRSARRLCCVVRPGFGPPDDLQEPAAPAIELTVRAANDRFRAERHERLRSLADAHAEEAPFATPMISNGCPSRADRLTDDGWIAGVATLPEALAEHGNAGTSAVIVGCVR